MSQATDQLIFQVKGHNGQVELYHDRIRLSRRGFHASLLGMRSKGQKDIYLKSITSVQLHCGLLQGYIKFTFGGSQDDKGGIFSAQKDENSVTFYAYQKSTFLKLRDMIASMSDGSIPKRNDVTIPRQVAAAESDRVTAFDSTQGRERQLNVDSATLAEAEAKAMRAGFQDRKVEIFEGERGSRPVSNNVKQSSEYKYIHLFTELRDWMSTRISVPLGQNREPFTTSYGILTLFIFPWFVAGVIIINIQMMENRNKPQSAYSPWQPTLLSSETDQAKSSQRQTTAGHPTKVLAQGLGLTYDEVTRGLTDWFSMHSATLANGRERYLGTAIDKLSMLEVIGSKSNASEATLLLGLPKDMPRAMAVRNGVILSGFVKNVMPDWRECLDDWVLPTIEELGKNESRSITWGGNIITIEKHLDLGYLLVKIMPK